MRPIDLGYVALTDAAPLIVAMERGFFESEGLRVRLHRELSWATIRDKVSAGVFQGAHMLAPLAIATNLGAASQAADIVAPLALNAHGASLGLSAALARDLDGADGDGQSALAKIVAQRRAAGAPKLGFAVVFPFSMHNYMLRYWLADHGVDPDDDVRILIAPPTSVAGRMRSGEIDGFAVGAPWGALCERQSAAHIVLESANFWRKGPEKVLALSGLWAARDPSQAHALVRALLQAALWADGAEAHVLATLLSPHLEAPADLIQRHLGEGRTSVRFARAAFPWRSHAAWQISQMLRWGQLDGRADLARGLNAYRPDLYRAAAAELGLNAPAEESKIEQLADGAVFDPARLREYAAGFAISRAKG